ncbi:hypothetical protein BsIDN1_32320 [Bacillus safensis]|uniref:HTH marR-type domain-containing protein n=1 Tax=Bacillus safensis TaxID=561879 RepID=A0A5S9MBT0_BACIA|nr:hypothetical protein BsIDN1_32320 [Bacillus safensis]
MLVKIKCLSTLVSFLEECDLTPAQYGVLNCLWREGQLSPKQIGELVYLEASTVSGILDKMQKLT